MSKNLPLLKIKFQEKVIFHYKLNSAENALD